MFMQRFSLAQQYRNWAPVIDKAGKMPSLLILGLQQTIGKSLVVRLFHQKLKNFFPCEKS